jgi:hypothetical protein
MAAGFRIDALAEAVARGQADGSPQRCDGDTSRRISGVAPLQSASTDHLGFLANPRYRAEAAATGAGALVLTAADRRVLFSAARAGRSDPDRMRQSLRMVRARGAVAGPGGAAGAGGGSRRACRGRRTDR